MEKLQIIIKLFNFLSIMAIGYIVVSCANPVSPVGGPKDEDPPQLIKADPPLFTKNFNVDKIKITFNEFLQLKDVTSQVIISPPMDKMPDFKTKGKSVVIELKEELKANTTYNIFMGNAIVDLTENNPATNFQYVFSTGDVIDSLSIQGNILKAFDLSRLENLNVMLYMDNNDTIEFDSLPYFVKPYYLSKTDVNGDFLLNNLSNNRYKLFVLLDLNGNMIYDQPTEEIAFLDSLIIPQYDPANSYKLAAMPDSTTEIILPDNLTEILPINLFLFQEVDSVQRLQKIFTAKNSQLIFYFKIPVTDLQIHPLSLPDEVDWYIAESNKTLDTITYWVKDIGQDSLTLEISDSGLVLDTAKVAVVKMARTRKEQKEEEEEVQKLTVIYNTNKKSLDLNQPLILTFDYPIASYDLSSLELFENDTIPIIPEFAFIDSNIQRKLAINYSWKQSTAYSMMFPDSVFYDIHGHSHDTLSTAFVSKSKEDYGNLHVSISILNPEQNHIVQLLSKDNIVSELVIQKDQRISYEFLEPGNYKLKVIYDMNNNGKWDSGNYIYKIQPEVVDFFPAEITIRANWDIEEEWEF